MARWLVARAQSKAVLTLERSLGTDHLAYKESKVVCAVIRTRNHPYHGNWILTINLQ
jgi:hypothetical protein